MAPFRSLFEPGAAVPRRLAATPDLRGLRGLLGTLVALAVVLAPEPAAATAKTPPGVPPAFFGVSGRHLDNQDFNDLEAAGVGTFRTLFNFHRAKRRPAGGYDWSHFDRLVGRMAARGIRVLPLLYGTPSWIYRHRTVPPIYDPRAREAWSQYLAQLVNRYGPNGRFWLLNPLIPRLPINAWQVWNEPNSTAFWVPTPSAGGYARLLHLSSAAIRRVDRDATVVSAGLVADPGGIGSIPGDVYLRQLAASRVVRESVDAYGYHPYASEAPDVKAELRAARLALRAVGAGTAPLWVTEVGWGSGGLVDELLVKTPEGQAEALERTYQMALARRGKLGIERVLWYYWRDHPDPLCIWCRSAGLLAHSHARKPAFAVFRRLTGG